MDEKHLNENQINLFEVFETLLNGKWIIIIITLMFSLIGYGYYKIKPEIFHITFVKPFFTLNNRQKLRNFPLPPYVKGRINELAEADFLVLTDYLKENGVLNELDDLIEKKKFKLIL